jgi:alkanesulfonate monooxygenase SsuD/methylene tetrahydromethanopterin reductase-like flavin-dependent oxidoreductase (luciferase family)
MEKANVERTLAYSIVGSPETVKRGLMNFIERTGADELIVGSQIFDHAARIHSYEIVAQIAAQLQQEISAGENIPQAASA